MGQNGFLTAHVQRVATRLMEDAGRYPEDERLSAFVARLSDELALISDALTRELFLDVVAQRLHVHPERFRRMVGNVLQSDGGTVAVLTPASDVELDTDGVQWLPLLGMDGYVARRSVTLLASAPKTGKSTLLVHTAQNWLDTARIVWLTEEPRELWQRRFEYFPVLRTPNLLLGFADRRVPPSAWWEQIERERPDVLVVDTVRAFLGIADENDASSVHGALQPVVELTRRVGCASIVVHHTRKDGDGYAGSHAFAGDVDIILELRETADGNPRRRELRNAGSRYDETPDAVLLELTSVGYRALGDAGAVNVREVADTLRGLLTADPQPTRRLWEQLPEPRPHYETVRRALQLLVETGHAERLAGSGRTPDRWRRCSTTAVSGTTQEPEDDPFAGLWFGLCARCGRDALPNSDYCATCSREVHHA